MAHKLNRTYNKKLKSIFQLWLIFGRLSAEIGPGTITKGSGLKDAAKVNYYGDAQKLKSKIPT